MFIHLRRLVSVLVLSVLAACASNDNPHQPRPSGTAIASYLIGDIPNWQPAPGQPTKPGGAAYGQVNIDNNRVNTQQVFETWTESGEPIPQGIIDRNRRAEYRRQHNKPYNQAHRPSRPRYCYDYQSRLQYRC
jgi:hypothetical protein